MKFQILAFILAAVLLIFTACAPVNAAVGSWTLTEKVSDGTPDSLNDLAVEYTFKNDGTFNMVVNDVMAAEGTYTFENNVLTWSVNNNSGSMTMVDGKLVHTTKVNDKVVVSTYEKH